MASGTLEFRDSLQNADLVIAIIQRLVDARQKRHGIKLEAFGTCRIDARLDAVHIPSVPWHMFNASVPESILPLWNIKTRRFSPSRIEQAYNARSAVKDAQTELSGRRSQLLQQYFANSMNGDDNSSVLEDIQAYNRGNPPNAITGEVIVKAIRQKQKARLKKERGLALSRKDEHLRALGRYGNYDPML